MGDAAVEEFEEVEEKEEREGGGEEEAKAVFGVLLFRMFRAWDLKNSYIGGGGGGACGVCECDNMNMKR